jgi:glutaredoxin
MDKPSRLIVYTIPQCHRCEELKRWLREHGMSFEERTMDTEARVELIMRNVFGDPPIIELGARTVSHEGFFRDEALDEERLMEVLGAEEG